VNHSKAGDTGITAIFTKVKGASGDSINPASGVQGNDGSCPYLLDSKAIVFIAIVGGIHRG
jgi:hypothetical protein